MVVWGVQQQVERLLSDGKVSGLVPTLPGDVVTCVVGVGGGTVTKELQNLRKG